MKRKLTQAMPPTDLAKIRGGQAAPASEVSNFEKRDIAGAG